MTTHHPFFQPPAPLSRRWHAPLLFPAFNSNLSFILPYTYCHHPRSLQERDACVATSDKCPAPHPLLTSDLPLTSPMKDACLKTTKELEYVLIPSTHCPPSAPPLATHCPPPASPFLIRGLPFLPKCSPNPNPACQERDTRIAAEGQLAAEQQLRGVLATQVREGKNNADIHVSCRLCLNATSPAAAEGGWLISAARILHAWGQFSRFELRQGQDGAAGRTSCMPRGGRACIEGRRFKTVVQGSSSSLLKQ